MRVGQEETTAHDGSRGGVVLQVRGGRVGEGGVAFEEVGDRGERSGLLLQQFQRDAAGNCEKASRGEIKAGRGINVLLCNGVVSRERGKMETSLI